MPDFRNFSVTRNGSVTTTIPRFTISCDVVNSSTGQLIREFKVNFPGILTGLSNEDLFELFRDLIEKIIDRKLEKNIS